MKLTDKRFWKFEALMLLCGMSNKSLAIYIWARCLLGKLYIWIVFFSIYHSISPCRLLCLVLFPKSYRMVAKSGNNIFPCHLVAICSSFWMDMYLYKRWYDRIGIFIGQFHGISILHFTRCNRLLSFSKISNEKLIIQLIQALTLLVASICVHLYSI